MADIIALIKELRERTGAGMMDCKKALLESNMDVAKAQAWLHEKGVLKAAKKADRVAAEGLSLVYLQGDLGLLIEVNCETDFVSRGEPFRQLVDATAALILKNQPASVDAAVALTQTLFTEATVKIGEKLSLRRFSLMRKQANQSFGQYVHMNGVVASLVLVEGGNPTFTDQLAMHITDRNPSYPSLAAVPASLIEEETALQKNLVKEDPKYANKPEAILAKIVEGKVNTKFKEASLDVQPFMFSETEELTKVFLEKNKTKVVQFARFKVGEGIEKKVVDFASEVMSQVKNTQ
ncbi:MAG: translation elongation factor Ts [Bacilli bacterium]